MLQEMYSDTLDMDISFDVPVRRPALFSRETFDVPVRPMDAKGLIGLYLPITYMCHAFWIFSGAS